MTAREIAIAVAILLIVAVGVFLFWRGRTRVGWRGRVLRIGGALVILLAGFTYLTWMQKRGARMPAPVFTVESPDGRFIAEIVEPEGDLLPTRLIRISVRRSRGFFAPEVFVGPAEPNVEWLNNQTVRFTYPLTTEKPKCGGSVSGVSIVCSEVPAASFKPWLRE